MGVGEDQSEGEHEGEAEEGEAEGKAREWVQAEGEYGGQDASRVWGIGSMPQ